MKTRAPGAQTYKKRRLLTRRGIGLLLNNELDFSTYIVLDPQVCFLDVLVAEQLFAASLQDNAAVFQYIGAVAQV